MELFKLFRTNDSGKCIQTRTEKKKDMLLQC
uniref:Uncharacterized protein n=1 Tax=viral metagenome TaxID=1070528 RepID=A0A6C0I5M9_9ZZZZ